MAMTRRSKVQHRGWNGSDSVYGIVQEANAERARVRWADGSENWHKLSALEPWVAEEDR